MANVFLSFARDDATFAHRLADALRGLGFETSDREEIVRGGEELPDALRDSLRRADGVIVVATDAALDSPSAMMELGAAWAAGKPVLAVHPAARPLTSALPTIAQRKVLQGDGLTIAQIASALSTQLSVRSGSPLASSPLASSPLANGGHE